MNKLAELKEELVALFSSNGAKILDSTLPLIVFLIANPLVGTTSAVWGAVGTAGLLAVFRVFGKGKLRYSLLGLAAVSVTAFVVNLSGSGEGFFLPGLVSGAVTVGVCILSVLVKRPLAAWSSFLTRRWPLEWYWHTNIRPAYSEVTLIWAGAFFVRLAVEFWLYQQGNTNTLGAVRLLLGWPYIVLLLIISYLYGLWRLGKLGGPSIEEFKSNQSPPWKGQKRGF